MSFIKGITCLAHAFRKKRLSCEVVYKIRDGVEHKILASPWFNSFQSTEGIDYESSPALTQKTAQWTILVSELTFNDTFYKPCAGDLIIDNIGGIESVNVVDSIGGEPQWIWNPSDPSKKTIIVFTVRRSI